MDSRVPSRAIVAAAVALGVPWAGGAQITTCTLVQVEDRSYRGACSDGTREQSISLSLTAENELFPWTGTVQSRFGPGVVHLAPPSDAAYPRGAIRRYDFAFDDLETYSLAGDSLTFSFHSFSGAAPSDLDRAIIDRADAIMSSYGWDAREPADCPERGSAVGLRCALRQASVELAGYLDVGQPALVLANRIVDEVAAGREDIDDLRTYNNHPEHTRAEVLAVLERARQRIDAGFEFRGFWWLGRDEDLSAAVTLGDVDGDDDLDVLVANGTHWPGENEIFLNDGTGFFKVERSLGQERSASYRIQLVDLDADGDLDAAVANDRAPNRLFLNGGDGWFDPAGTFGAPDPPTRDLGVGDLDGDGAPDLFVLNRDGPSEICFNDGEAVFADCRPFLGQESAIKIALGDMNEDGALDLILANQYASQNYILLNDGTGTFPERRPFGTGADETLTVAVADLDADGHLDVVTGNTNQPGGVYYGDGTGGFVPGAPLGAGADTYRVTVGDVNLDGYPDLLFANAWAVNWLYLNRGGRDGFDELAFGSHLNWTLGLAIGDVTGDGVPDVVEANDEGENRIFIGRLHRSVERQGERDRGG